MGWARTIRFIFVASVAWNTQVRGVGAEDGSASATKVTNETAPTVNAQAGSQGAGGAYAASPASGGNFNTSARQNLNAGTAAGIAASAKVDQLLTSGQIDYKHWLQ